MSKSSSNMETLSLSPKQEPRLPRTKVLVVCGAYRVDDQWLFSNLVGFYRALSTFNTENIFLNCFPIDEWWALKDNQQHKDIKFGLRNDKPERAVSVYTKREHDHKERFYTQYDAETETLKMQTKIRDIIKDAADNSIMGDAFTLILIGHGNDSGTKIGKNIIKPAYLENWYSSFKEGVQVNTVVQGCHSGIFVDAFKNSTTQRRQRYVHTSCTADQVSYSTLSSPSGRYRNSIFSAVWLESLGMAYRPSRDSESQYGEWTLQSHIAYVKREGADTGRSGPSVPHGYTSDIPVVTKFLEVLYANYVDSSFKPPTAARRVLTPVDVSTIIGPANQFLKQSESDKAFVVPNSIKSAKEILAKEIERAYPDVWRNTQVPENDLVLVDICFNSETKHRNKTITTTSYGKRLAEGLAAMKWRFRAQAAIWLAFQTLENRNLVTLQGFQEPIDWNTRTNCIKYVTQILLCFEFLDHCADPGNGVQGRFQAPVTWLAIMIARSGSQWCEIFGCLESLKFLGKFDYDEFDDCRNNIAKIKFNPREMVPPKTRSYDTLPSPCFWLPEACPTKKSRTVWAKCVKDRFATLEQEYTRTYGEGSWGDDGLLMESLAQYL